jgi:hypothetical protein
MTIEEMQAEIAMMRLPSIKAVKLIDFQSLRKQLAAAKKGESKPLSFGKNLPHEVSRPKDHEK